MIIWWFRHHSYYHHYWALTVSLGRNLEWLQRGVIFFSTKNRVQTFYFWWISDANLDSFNQSSKLSRVAISHYYGPFVFLKHFCSEFKIPCPLKVSLPKVVKPYYIMLFCASGIISFFWQYEISIYVKKFTPW